MKKSKIAVAVVLVCILIYFLPMSSEKVLKRHNVPVEKINQAGIAPLNVGVVSEIIDIEQDNRQVKEFLTNLKVRRAIPGEVKKTMIYYHDG